MEVIKSNILGMDIFQVVELEIGSDVQGVLAHVATPEEVAKIGWLFPRYVADDGSFRSIVQSFVFNIRDRVFIIDTCIGNDKPRAIDKPGWNDLQTQFLDNFRKTGFSLEDVTDVLCTHMHMDHVGWNTTLHEGRWVPTFPNAKHYFSRTEFQYWITGPEAGGRANNLAFKDSVQPIFDADMAVLVDDAADLGDGVSLVPTPGHTPGHVSVCVQTAAGYLYVTGDSIHHPCQLAHTEWSTSIDFSRSTATQSRRKLVKLASRPGAYLAGTHFAVPSIGRVVQGADGGASQFIFETDVADNS